MKTIRLKKIPVIVQLYPRQIHEADLMRELKINRHDLDREMMRQPARYGFWAALYSTVATRVEELQDKLDRLEAKLFIHYTKSGVAKRATDLKFYVTKNPKYVKLKDRLRRWKASERVLKYSALKGFEQRTFMLQALAANKRREWDSEVTRKQNREEE
jgi:hypothetical protein